MERPNRRILIIHPSGVKRLPPAKRSTAQWIYLGKDVRRRSQVESLLNPACCMEEGERFHRLAESTRQPFLDFVAGVGTLQSNPVVWWSTSFSWRMWESCDLFLLVVYLALATELIRETLSNPARSLILVVEDPWLCSQLKESHFMGSGSLALRKIHALLLGAARRSAWWVRTLQDFWRQKKFSPGDAPRVPHRPAVALYSFPLKTSLVGETGWQDPYLPGLDKLLEELGYEVIRFAPPDRRGFERELGQRHNTFQPLILHVTAGGVWRALTAFWRPRWPKELVLLGLPVRRLVQREWWLEMSRSNLCSNRMFYECLQSMLRRGSWQWVIFPYENQPWEKLAILSARGKKVRSVGIQTALISRYYLPHFLGAGEQATMPLPDFICTAGPEFREILREGGILEDRLLVAGSIRYPHVSEPNAEREEIIPRLRQTAELLVLLPIDRCLAEHLLAALNAVFPDSGASAELRFLIRPHPLCPVDLTPYGFPLRNSPSSLLDLRDSFRTCDLVLFAGSTVGLEALAAGKKVLRYRSGSLLDVDEVYGARVPVCSNRTLRQAIADSLASQGAASPDRIRSSLSQLFSPLDRRVLERLFTGASQQERELESGMVT